MFFDYVIVHTNEGVVFCVEHMATVDVMITYSTSCKSKTILDLCYGFVLDVDSLPAIDCLACRLEETR